MSKNYHESRQDQMNKKIHGMESSQHENVSHPRSQSMETEHILRDEAVHHSSIQLLAYQIYKEKGGNALDNWLEAERILRYYHHK